MDTSVNFRLSKKKKNSDNFRYVKIQGFDNEYQEEKKTRERKREIDEEELVVTPLGQDLGDPPYLLKYQILDIYKEPLKLILFQTKPLI